MKSGKRELKLLAPMGVIVAIAVCALITSLWVWTEKADALARTREENLVRLGLNQMADDHSQLMTPITIWDKAVQSTAVKYDPDWVGGNIGHYFQSYLKFESSLLLDANNRPVAAYSNGSEVAPDTFAGLKRETEANVAELRRRWAANHAATTESNHVGRLIAIGGHIYIMGASLLVPDGTTPGLDHYTPFAAVGAHELSRSELVGLSQRYMVSNITMLKPGDPRPANAASVVFRDDNGKVLAELSWMPDTPGHTLFLRTLGPILLISLTLGLVALILLHQSQKAAQGLIASEAKAKHMALHDALTNLPNRTLFADRLIQACERIKRSGGQVCVMCIGLDRFKDVNDTLGHAAGDELIRNNAAKISAMIRSCDTVARLGGDEFVIIQTDSDGHSSSTLARRVLDALTGKVDLESGQVFS
ncbi:MAG: diguanylate cyclase domain-containing protein, partial [Asticcacaulis sp.]